MMSAEQRGVYCSIIFYLYCNEGKIELSDNTPITLLQDKYSKIAIISGCQKIGADWDAVWSKIADKFQINENILTHKRVTEELKRAKEFKEQKSRAGKDGMKKRWGDNTTITKVSKVKLSKDNIKEYCLNSDEFRLASLLFDEIKKRKPDFKEPNLQIWSRYIDKTIRIDNRTPTQIEAVIKWCQRDDFWQNNILSTNKLRKQFDRLELQLQKGNENGRKRSTVHRPNLNEQDFGELISTT